MLREMTLQEALQSLHDNDRARLQEISNLRARLTIETERAEVAEARLKNLTSIVREMAKVHGIIA